MAVDERGLAVDQPHAVALTVVYRDLLEPQLFSVHVAAVAHDAVLTAMNVGIRQPVLKGGTIEMQALPLPADTVVGQIIEHSVQATATQHHFLARRSAYDQPPVHVYSGSMVEIKRRTGFDGQRGPFMHFDSPRNNNGAQRTVERRVALDVHEIVTRRIPTPCPQLYTLLHAALQREDKLVGKLLRAVSDVSSGRSLHKHAQAVATIKHHVARLKPVVSIQRPAVHIDPEARLIATCQSDIGETQPRTVRVIHPELMRGRRSV